MFAKTCIPTIRILLHCFMKFLLCLLLTQKYSVGISLSILFPRCELIRALGKSIKVHSGKFFLKITYIKNEFIYLLKIFIKSTAKDVSMLEIAGIQKLLLKEPEVSVDSLHFYTYWLSSPPYSCRQTPLKCLYFIYFIFLNFQPQPRASKEYL